MRGIHVGARGFEPPTSWSQTTRSTKLSYAPNMQRVVYHGFRTRASGRAGSSAHAELSATHGSGRPTRSSTPNSARAFFPLQRWVLLAASRNQLPDRARSDRPRNTSNRDAKNRVHSHWLRDASRTTPSI